MNSPYDWLIHASVWGLRAEGKGVHWDLDTGSYCSDDAAAAAPEATLWSVLADAVPYVLACITPLAAPQHWTGCLQPGLPPTDSDWTPAVNSLNLNLYWSTSFCHRLNPKVLPWLQTLNPQRLNWPDLADHEIDSCKSLRAQSLGVREDTGT